MTLDDIRTAHLLERKMIVTKAFFKHCAWEILNCDLLKTGKVCRGRDIKSKVLPKILSKGIGDGLNHRAGFSWALRYLLTLGLLAREGRKGQGLYRLTDDGQIFCQNHSQENLFHLLENRAQAHRARWQERNPTYRRSPKKTKSANVVRISNIPPIVKINVDGVHIEGDPKDCADFVRRLRRLDS
jgi:hypothetical protein